MKIIYKVYYNSYGDLLFINYFETKKSAEKYIKSIQETGTAKEDIRWYIIEIGVRK